MDHYDLLARPDWTAVSVLVVSPYVERSFFSRIVMDLQPETLTVVVDDGCRKDDVKMIQSLARKGTSVRVVLGSARGLVHAKIFHVEWLTTGGNRAHTLVYGSGNATRQAFEGDINSELMCKVRLTAINHADVLDWLESVRAAASDSIGDNPEIPALRDAWLADGVSIRLPSLMLKDAQDKASNLDQWLQRGRILSKYQPDASFLRVHLNLRKELPAGELVNAIRQVGFETPRAQRLSIPYIPTIKTQDSNDSMVNFLSRFFVWTQLGYWCSDACFRERSHLFKKSGHERRLENLLRLEQLKDLNSSETACSRFLDRIYDLWAALGDLAETYLESRDGEVDADAYRSLFNQRVQRDIDLASDEEFRDRYINGYEVIPVPRFRIDAAAWRSFVDSLARQIHLEWLKMQSQSLVYQYIYHALMDDGLVDYDNFDDPEALSKLLRLNWNTVIMGDDGEETTVGEYIDVYYAGAGPA
jgi:hypothetical protein